jgi:hypothetical protein
MINMVSGGKTPWYKKIFGAGLHDADEGPVLGQTTANGYTVLDADKLVASDHFEEKLQNFVRERNFHSNGHSNGSTPPEKKS